uniref:BAR domain-containing protein n=1 Tax=Anopheles maculatus TaxID=74869 RepID=A0A182SDL9_9DIPT
MIGQQAAERDLRVAQSEFDRQAEITKLLLEGISTTQATHLRYLHSFVEAQVRYYGQCNKIMSDLQRELVSMRPPTPRLRVNSEDVDLTCGPPYLSKYQTQDSAQHYQQTITLHPAALTASAGKPPLAISPETFPIVDDSVIAALVADSDPNDISVL